jgi:hypothetical protein
VVAFAVCFRLQVLACGFLGGGFLVLRSGRVRTGSLLPALKVVAVSQAFLSPKPIQLPAVSVPFSLVLRVGFLGQFCPLCHVFLVSFVMLFLLAFSSLFCYHVGMFNHPFPKGKVSMSHPLPFSLPADASVLVGGSRALVAGSPAWVACQSFSQACTHAVHVGCATGADQAAVLALGFDPHPYSSHVFAAFAPSGAGAFGGSAVSTVQRFASLGGSVSWLAGGSLSVPLVARLMARSVAALAGCSAAVFFAPGVGSLKVARHALRAGIPVLVSCVGLSSAPVLAVPSVLVSWLGQSFWLFAPPVQGALF